MPRAKVSDHMILVCSTAAHSAINDAYVLLRASSYTIPDPVFFQIRKSREYISSIRNRAKKKPVVAALMTLVHEIYNRGYPLDELSTRVGISPAWISIQLRAIGLQLRSAATRTAYAQPPKRKYKVNIHAFEQIEAEESAYTLGFLHADGNIAQSGNRPEGVRVRLQAGDASILYEIRRVFGSNAPIELKLTKGPSEKLYGQAHLLIYSTTLAERLQGLGLGRAKCSHEEFVPPVQSDTAKKNFWRGMLDGDGSIGRESIERVKYPLSGWRMQFCGDYGVVKAFCQYVEEITNRHINFYRNGNSKVNWSCMLPNLETIVMAEHLYEGSTIALHRKKRIADALMLSWKRAKKEGVTINIDANGRRTFKNKRESHKAIYLILKEVITAAGRAGNTRHASPDYFWATHPRFEAMIDLTDEAMGAGPLLESGDERTTDPAP